MPRTVSNLLIVLAMAIVVTGVLALTSDPARVDETTSERIESLEPAAPAADTDADADEAASGATSDSTSDTSSTDDATPSYLDPEPTDAGDDAQVLGVTQVQETEEQLADTGLLSMAHWVVFAATSIALGAVTHSASRDHAAGRLTLLP